MPTPNKKKLGGALAGTLKAEEDKFSRADKLFAKSETPVSAKPFPSPSNSATRKATEPKEGSPRVVATTFTMPETDVAIVGEIRKRALKNATAVTKSEVVRAALQHLARLDDTELVKILSAVPKLKTGRPKQKKG